VSTTSVTTTKATPAEGQSSESFAFGPDGTRLYVRRRTGPSTTTFLLSDGICCDGFIYKYLWDDLGRFACTAHWNYRGHGRSANPADPELIGVDAHVSDLDSVRRHLGDPPVVLVGHSFGTQVALEAYRLRPEGVRGLVMLCGSYGRVTHTFKNSEVLANVLPKLSDFASRHPKLARALWSRVPPKASLRIALFTGEIDPHTIRAEDVEPYFQHVAHVDFPMFVKMLAAAGEHSSEDMLTSIDVPVLIVAGDHDSFTPPDLSRRMAELIPKAELVMLSGGTHVAPLEQHELVSLRIEKFMVEHGLS
jgi:pimeloyl-ACP methyl ester carboxylesterase